MSPAGLDDENSLNEERESDEDRGCLLISVESSGRIMFCGGKGKLGKVVRDVGSVNGRGRGWRL